MCGVALRAVFIPKEENKMKKAIKVICGITLSLAFAYGVFKLVYTILTEKKDYFDAPL